jgi:hypothetical protein
MLPAAQATCVPRLFAKAIACMMRPFSSTRRQIRQEIVMRQMGHFHAHRWCGRDNELPK